MMLIMTNTIALFFVNFMHAIVMATWLSKSSSVTLPQLTHTRFEFWAVSSGRFVADSEVSQNFARHSVCGQVFHKTA